jgi:hypothetical protein
VGLGQHLSPALLTMLKATREAVAHAVKDGKTLD